MTKKILTTLLLALATLLLPTTLFAQKTVPIGDRAAYFVHGNVSAVTYKEYGRQITVRFDAKGLEILKAKCKNGHKTDEQGRRLTTRSFPSGDFWGDNIYYYDQGRLVGMSLLGDVKYEYDAKGRIVAKYVSCEGSDEKTVYTYDTKGNVVKESLYTVEEDGSLTLDRETLYYITRTDSHGNWITRSHDGEKETRRITYFK